MNSIVQPPGRRRWLLYLCAFAVFFIIRWFPSGFGPTGPRRHADESHYAEIALTLKWSHLNPDYFQNPPLLTYTLFGAKELSRLFIGENLTNQWVEADGLIWLARFISAITGAATAIVIANICKVLFPSLVIEFGALLISGFSFLHGRNSHFGVNDVPMLFVACLSMREAAKVFVSEKVNWKTVAFSAIWAGIAAATKYNGAIVIILAPLALLLRATNSRFAAIVDCIKGSVLSVVLFLMAFALANPYFILDFDEFMLGFRNQLIGWGDSYAQGQEIQHPIENYLEGSLGLVGYAHVVAALLGIVLLYARNDYRLLIFIIATPALYLAGMSTKNLFYWRFAIPLLPFLAIFAAVFWQDVVDRVFIFSGGRRGRKLVVAGILIIFSTAEPAVKLVKLDMLLAYRSTWRLAWDWMRSRIPRGQVIYSEMLPVLSITQSAKAEHTLSFTPLSALKTLDPPDVIAKNSTVDRTIGWIVTDDYVRRVIAANPARAAESEPFYQRLEKTFIPEVVFATTVSKNSSRFVIDEIYAPLFSLFDMQRPGTTVKIYKVTRDEWDKFIFFSGRSTPLPDRVSVASTISLNYGSDPSQTIQIYRPIEDSHSGKRPAVIWFPGGGFSSALHTIDPRDATWQEFFRRGWIVITASYRTGVGTFPRAHEDATSLMQYVRYYSRDDVKGDAKQRILHEIDPSKIAVIGLSAGGNLAACLATSYDLHQADSSGISSESKRPGVAVVIDAITNWTILDTDKMFPESQGLYFGALTRESWKAIPFNDKKRASPAILAVEPPQRAENWKIPILSLYHSDPPGSPPDNWHDGAFGTALYEALRSIGNARSQMEWTPGAGADFTVQEFARAAEFINLNFRSHSYEADGGASRPAGSRAHLALLRGGSDGLLKIANLTVGEKVTLFAGAAPMEPAGGNSMKLAPALFHLGAAEADRTGEAIFIFNFEKARDVKKLYFEALIEDPAAPLGFRRSTGLEVEL